MKWIIKTTVFSEDILDLIELKGKTSDNRTPKGSESTHTDDDGVPDFIVRYSIINGPDIPRESAKLELINDELQVVENTSKKEVLEKWLSVDLFIRLEAEKTFETKRSESQMATAIEYLLRILNPTAYLGKNLIAEVATDSFNQGSELNDVNKIKSYYTELMGEFSEKRNEKIKEYKDLREFNGV